MLKRSKANESRVEEIRRDCTLVSFTIVSARLTVRARSSKGQDIWNGNLLIWSTEILCFSARLNPRFRVVNEL